MKILVTGVAGFIGMHTAAGLLARGDEVVGLDNLNEYYDPQLKRDRLAQLEPHGRFRFVRQDISDQASLAALFAAEGFERVVHLAGQAGVRHSILNPHAYAQSNLVGFLNVLEGCRRNDVGHLVYASSSSVYGNGTRMPLSESDPVDRPVSLYAATKKANELMAHSYSHLYGLATTGLRFFTVYGPWGRPDMAPYLFTDAIARGLPIDVFNDGKLRRGFTYIDDVVRALVACVDRAPQVDDEPEPSGGAAPDATRVPYRIFNIGSSEAVELERFIAAIESALGQTARKKLLPMQPGDVIETSAATARLQAWVGFRPQTSIEDGVASLVGWYRQYSAR